MTEEDEIQIRYIDPYFPKEGVELYVWGAIRTQIITKKEYMELFGDIARTNKSEKKK